ncbi:MAG TPA: carboxypeptidase regulatory-like domain-containing protein [Sedimentisphaerales bacterium]|nr:carboxypeptidase regulatory-like domain-containing protein [Sedimentisphaerales bacterium]
MKNDSNKRIDAETVEKMVGRMAARPSEVADRQTFERAEAAYRETRAVMEAGRRPGAHAVFLHLLQSRRGQVAMAAAVLLLIVAGVHLLYQDGAEQMAQNGRNGSAAELASVRKLYETRNIKGLTAALGTAGLEAKVAAANFLAVVGDSSAIEPLEKAGVQWKGDAAANPFTKAAAAIVAREGVIGAAAATDTNAAPAAEAAPVPSSPEIAAVPAAPAEISSADPTMTMMVVTVVDKATGRPLEGAQVRLMYVTMGERHESALETDQKGLAVVRIPTTATYLRVNSRSSGYVSMFREWQGRDLELPKVCIFALEKAISIGGIVNDPNGMPLKGVTVSVHARGDGKDPSEEAVVYVSEELITDADGKWFCDVVPPEMSGLSLSFEHPRYLIAFSEPSDAQKESLTQMSFAVTMEAGRRLHGVVRSADGTPIPGATVSVGGERSATRRVRTDEYGRFEFHSIEEGDEVVVARRKRFAPELKSIPWDNLEAGVEFVLGPGHVLRGRVTNSRGVPLPGAVVFMNRWRGHQLFGVGETCDPNGRFVMNSLPGDELEISIFHPGYMKKRLTGVIADGQDREYVLRDMLRVSGTVVDAETGQPVKDFLLIPGIAWSEGDSDEIVWQTDRSIAKSFRDGRYEYQFRHAATRYAVRIEAEGYAPAESEPIDANAASAVRDFRINRCAGVNGVVVLPDGTPVAGAVVTTFDQNRGVTIANGDLMNEEAYRTVRTDAGGRFHLPDPGGEYHVVAVSTAGVGVVAGEVLKEKGTLVIEPWGRLEGQCMVGSKPAVNWQVSAHYPQQNQHRLPLFVHNDSVTTDEHGRFVLDKLVPGFIRVYCSSGSKSLMAEAEIAAGQTTYVNLGGDGWKVTADLAIPSDLQERIGELIFSTTVDEALDFKGWIEHVPWPADVDTMSSAALSAWLKEFAESPAGMQLSNELHAARHKGRRHEVEISGSKAVIEDVLPGDYHMVIRLYESDSKALRATAFTEFTVPPGSPLDYDTALDLGKLELRKRLAEGMAAPDLEIDSISDGQIHLSNFQGKVVLLVILDTRIIVAEADALELQRISQYMAARSDSKMVAIVSASRANPVARAHLRDLGLACIQGFYADEFMSLYSKYPADNTGAGFSTVLIGRDGQVLALGLKGQELIDRIAEVLAE